MSGFLAVTRYCTVLYLGDAIRWILLLLDRGSGYRRTSYNKTVTGATKSKERLKNVPSSHVAPT